MRSLARDGTVGMTDSPSPRTLNGLEAHVAVIKARVEAVEQLAIEREDRNKERFTAMKTAVDAALAASDRAVSKAEISTEKRFDSVNEFRAALQDQAALQVTRTEYTSQHQNLIDKIATQDRYVTEFRTELSRITARGAGKQEGISTVAAIILGLIAAASAMSAIGLLLVTLLRH